MNPGNKRESLPEFFSRYGVRYKWAGTWPAIPVKLAPLESDERALRETTPVFIMNGTHVKMPPPDVAPDWVERIYERLFEKILPLKKGMSLEFLDAAIFGYAYAAMSRELAAQGAASPWWAEQKVISELQRTLDACRPRVAKLQKQRTLDACRRRIAELQKHYERTLDACRHRIAEVLASWKLPEAANYMRGFAYGIDCQHREEGWTPSATTETLQIYKALLRCQYAVRDLTMQKATAREIGQYIASHATKSDGMTFAEYFMVMGANPTYSGRLAEVKARAGKKPWEGAAAQVGAEECYLRLFQKICGEVGIPLPRRGRPAGKSPGV